MPRRIKKYAGPFDIATMVGPVWNADGDTGGGGSAPPVKDGEASPPSDGEAKPDDDKASGAGDTDWKSKFDGQQKVNRDLEGKLNQLRDGLKAALGVEDKKADAPELLAQMQKQLDAMAHESAVNEVARSHGITDTTDLDLLRSSADRAAMEKLAARLAPSKDGAQQNPSGKPGTPKPDPSQGRGGSRGATGSVSAGSDLWDETHKKTTN